MRRVISKERDCSARLHVVTVKRLADLLAQLRQERRERHAQRNDQEQHLRQLRRQDAVRHRLACTQKFVIVELRLQEGSQCPRRFEVMRRVSTLTAQAMMHNA